jgi:hypothetical protein
MNHPEITAALLEIRRLADGCILAVGNRPKMGRTSTSKRSQLSEDELTLVDFGKPVRPFIKAYCKGLSGPRKFTLLLSWLAKGDAKKQVTLSDLQKQWNRMKAKSLLGMKFNLFFPAAARDNDWVESRDRGVYNLRPGWRDALKSNG